MKVVTDLRLSDILAINVQNYVSNRARYVVCGVIALAYMFFLIVDLGLPADRRAWLIYVAGGILFSVAFFVLFLILGVMNALVVARNTTGVIGPHEVRIMPEGLRDITPMTDSLTRWPGMFRITRNGNYLAFWISPYLAHIVPRRAFADADLAGVFERLAHAYLRGESPVPQRAPPPPPPPRAPTDPALWKRPA